MYNPRFVGFLLQMNTNTCLIDGCLACVAGRDRSRAQSFGLVEEKKPRGEWGGDALKSRLPED